VVLLSELARRVLSLPRMLQQIRDRLRVMAARPTIAMIVFEDTMRERLAHRGHSSGPGLGSAVT
jgi:hypothetical protein